MKMSYQADDYDAFQPCFFKAEIEDDFYDSPAPSEDIWKKFELLPNPPTSPKHEPLYSPLGNNNNWDKLQMVSDVLDSDSSYLTETLVYPLLQSPHSSGAMSPGAFSSVSSGEDSADDSDSNCSECVQSTSTCLRCIPLGSKLIQDCMWSGLNLPKELKSSASSTQKSTTSYNRSKSTGSVDSQRSRSSLSESSDTINRSDCVDPTAVFPFPVNECSLKTRPTSSLDIPDNLGAETSSDSDEEIDVVTVGKKKVIHYQKAPAVVMTLRKRVTPLSSVNTTPASSTPASPTPAMSNSSMCAQVAAMHNYTAAPSSEPRSCSSTPSKRSRISHGGPPLKRYRISTSGSTTENDLRSVVQKLQHSGHSSHHGGSKSSSCNSSDSEGRRAQHNVLERKRRNDLKSSFHTLRDHIPELSSQERAPKVVILKKATDYIWSLRRTHSKHQSELEQLQRTNEKLRRHLAQLQSS